MVQTPHWLHFGVYFNRPLRVAPDGSDPSKAGRFKPYHRECRIKCGRCPVSRTGTLLLNHLAWRSVIDYKGSTNWLRPLTHYTELTLHGLPKVRRVNLGAFHCADFREEQVRITIRSHQRWSSHQFE